MRKHFIAAGLVCASLLAFAAQKSDPVLMKVAGKDVPLSEFEYLFHKNNSQQAQPQSVDDYVGMFVDYKLKVADAEANGIDTTATFVEEFTKYRDELAQPYLTDRAVLDSLVQQAYSHMAEEVVVSHIMMPNGKAGELDSLRSAILSGKTTFEEAARRYSMDKPSANRGGLMGTVTAGRYPWAFEEMAFITPVGEISPVINSGFGEHIIRVESHTPARGEVNARHILRMTRGVDPEKLPAQKALIDSIYQVVKADPSKFEQLAQQLSEDPGSGRRGGSLGWFGPGMMVQEFDSVSFALPVGAISEPFQTAFGWHIIKKEDARGVAPLDEVRDRIEAQINNSERGTLPTRAFIDRAMTQYKASLNEANLNRIAAMATEAGGSAVVLDSALIAKFATSDMPVYTIGGKTLTLGQLTDGMTPNGIAGADNIAAFIKARATQSLDAAVMDHARADLSNTNTEYRNLVNEYRDGILLFEISNRNVWDKASKDKAGLEEYFRTHRDAYKWESPKFKSYIIFANNDSLVQAAVAFAGTLPADLAPTDFTQAMRERFGRDIKVERVIAAKGDNPITDYLAFGGVKPVSENTRWNCYAAFGGRLLDAPEEAADSRGLVVSDYQAALEKQWLEQLHKKYPVKINKKVLKNVK